MNSNGVMLRRLRHDEADYRLLDIWCSRESVYRYFKQRILSPEEIRRKYYPRTLEDAAVPVYMIEAGGRPAGIIQYQAIGEESRICCGLSEENGYEIDLFIGEENLRGRGVGQAAVGLLTQFLFDQKAAEAIALCPESGNLCALRCYQKCGFQEKGRFSAPDTVGILQEYVCLIRTKKEK